MLVSVLIPTWQRRELLTSRCLPSVFNQTHPDVEAVVVSDGPDPELAALLDGQPGVRFAALPDHLAHPNNRGGRARNAAADLATGDILAYLDDDNAWRPSHLERLVAALEADPAADFAYSRMLVHPAGYEVGSAPPACNHIDTSLLACRRHVPARFGRWAVPGGAYAIDWELIAAWLAAGARWAFVPEVTVDYYSATR
jgi:glycosyltransferase involved in cell wall biosynthesis